MGTLRAIDGDRSRVKHGHHHLSELAMILQHVRGKLGLATSVRDLDRLRKNPTVVAGMKISPLQKLTSRLLTHAVLKFWGNMQDRTLGNDRPVAPASQNARPLDEAAKSTAFILLLKILAHHRLDLIVTLEGVASPRHQLYELSVRGAIFDSLSLPGLSPD